MAALLCLCLLAALCACKAKPATPDDTAAQTEEAEQNTTTETEPSETTEATENAENGYVGIWYEETNGRGVMEVTRGDNDTFASQSTGVIPQTEAMSGLLPALKMRRAWSPA